MWLRPCIPGCTGVWFACQKYGNVSEDVGFVSPVFVDVPILHLNVTVIKEAYWFKLSHLVSTLQCASGKPTQNRHIFLFIEFDCLESYLQTCQNLTTSEFTQQVCCVDIALVIPLQPHRSYSKALELHLQTWQKKQCDERLLTFTNKWMMSITHDGSMGRTVHVPTCTLKINHSCR